MTAYDQMIKRGANPGYDGSGAGVNADPLQIPEKVSRDIMQEAVKQSVMLQLARTETMSSRTERMPALDLFPTATWLGTKDTTAVQEDTTLKQTTQTRWKNITMEAREIAVMVPVPDAYVADTGFDLLAQIKPRIGEAIGYALDAACLFGVNNPWANNPYATGIYSSAVAAGNSLPEGSAVPGGATDVAANIAQLNYILATKGFSTNGYASTPGYPWVLSQARTSQGVNPYNPGGGIDGVPATFFGRPFREVENGSWDATKAKMIVGDWSKALIGIRQDLTMKVFDSGIIQDQNGAIVYNAMQQDGKVLRVVARFAFAVMSYKTVLSKSTDVYPFAVLRTANGPLS